MLTKQLESLSKICRNSARSFLLLCIVSLISLFCITAGSKDAHAYVNDKSPNFSAQQNLIFGADIYAPYFFLDDEGKFTGIDHDLIVEACKRLGYNPVFRIIKWSDKNELLDKAEIDAIISCFTMEGRENMYTWVGPYMASRQSIMVRSADNINTLDDLNGRRICVQNSSKPDELFKHHFSPDLKKFPVESALLVFNSIEQTYTAFQQKACDAFAAHEAVLASLAGNDKRYQILEEYLEAVSIGIAFHKNGNRIVAESLTRTLNQMTHEGFTQKIVAKYGIQYLAPHTTHHSHKIKDSDFSLDISL